MKRELPVEGAACCDLAYGPRLSDRGAEGAAGLFKALADPARLQILDILSQQAGEVCACDFEGRVGLPGADSGQRPKQPTISHHLKVLREAGLVTARKRGLWVYYSVRPERLDTLRAILDLLGTPARGAAPARPANGAEAERTAQPGAPARADPARATRR
jgi:ArsR family transcriptional regulator